VSSCKKCHGKGWHYGPIGDPVRHQCAVCSGKGQKPAEQVRKEGRIEPLGARKRLKMAQVREMKLAYLRGENEGKCQLCRDSITMDRSDFSHKTAAGMGGAGDKGGQVQEANGTYSCRCCHAFIEQDREAFNEHQASPANISNGLPVYFTAPVKERLKAFRAKWYNIQPKGANA